MFCLKTSLRTIPSSQCHRHLSITSEGKNREPTSEKIKFARAKVRIHVILESVYKTLLLRHTNFSSQVGDFVQSEPQHENPFTSDGFLQSYLSRLLPREAEHVIRSDLQSFGDRCASEIQVQG